MPSRSFLIKRLNGFNHEALAIVVIESTLPTGGINKDVMEAFLDEYSSSLISFVEKVNIKPSDLAEKTGF